VEKESESQEDEGKGGEGREERKGETDNVSNQKTWQDSVLFIVGN